MANMRILSSRDVDVTVPTPKHVIIWPRMTQADWKEFFTQQKLEASTPVESLAYERCLKTLMWAEFCNGTLTKVGNSKDENGLSVCFSFQFPNLQCRLHFDCNLDTNVNAVTLH